jgi:hypothetical protein
MVRRGRLHGGMTWAVAGPEERTGSTTPVYSEQMSLDRLLGTWDFTMHHSVMVESVTGRQRYERVLDGAYVLLTWTYDHPDFPDAMAMLSPENMYYFDVRGVTRVFDLQIDEGGWSTVRLDAEFSQRNNARFDGPDAIDTAGEYSSDRGASWQHDFTMRSIRTV